GDHFIRTISITRSAVGGLCPLFVAVGLSVVWPSAAGAFSTQGQKWPNTAQQPVPYLISPAGTDDVSDGSDLVAVRQAFSTWQAVSCAYLTFEEQAWSGQSVVQNDGVNRIFWVEESTNWPAQAGTLALTYTFYSLDGGGTITDADMILNGVNWRWTTDAAQVGQGSPAQVDVETVLLHEAGHFFGLAHSQDPTAAMFPSNNKDTQREPATDDVQGICTLYPNGEPLPGTGSGGAPVGSPCQTNADCASGACLEDFLVQRRYCSRICVVGQTDACPAGLVCEAAGDGNNYCLAPAPVDELCDQCSNGEQCASGLCVTVPTVNNLQPFCSQACDPSQPAATSCPSGYRCEVTNQIGTLVGTCVPNTGLCDPVGKGGQNELCFANGGCKPGHRCVEYFAGSGLFFCHAECSSSLIGQSCGLARTSCQPVRNLMNTAACFTFATIGEPCIPEVCDNRSFCAWDENVGIDSALCYQLCTNGQSDCPANAQCQSFEGLPPLCVPNPGFKQDGDVCQSNEECESRVCRPFGNGSLCTRACDLGEPNDCTPGLRCVTAAGSTAGFCGPQAVDNPDEPDRDVRVPADEFCACDRTNSCDEDCDCDPECGDSGCSCRSGPHETSGWPTAGFAFLLIVAALRFRRFFLS
ncbi:MAG: matrixin family metalloprotease, partial [Myxococcota bacterium]